MTWKDYDAIMETLDVLSGEDAIERLLRSIRDIREGKAIPWDEAKVGLRP